MTTDSKSDMSQIQVVGEPPPKSWKDYRQGCHSTFAGEHHKKETHLAFSHGMNTVFNLLEAEFPPAELCKAALSLRNTLGCIITYHEQAGQQILPASLLRTARAAIAKAAGPEGR